MRAECAFLLFASTLSTVSFAQEKKVDQVGYIYCKSDGADRSVPVFLDPCMKLRGGTFSCGQKMEVLAQSGSAIKVLTLDGIARFVKSDVVSQKADVRIPIEANAKSAPECKVAAPDPTKNRPPRVVFQPYPDFPQHAPRTRDETTVSVALVVGVDGRPHDVRVEGSPRKDFAKSAVEAVQKWRFEPALKDGQPVEMPIHADVSFRKIY